MTKSVLFCAALAATLCAGSALAIDDSYFAYQGRLLRNSGIYEGDAQFLFAIVVEEGGQEEIFWSSDPLATFSPVASSAPVELNVTRGSFSIQIGDETVPNMEPIDPSIWNQSGKYFLRVWVRGNSAATWEQLTPDQRIANPSSYGRESRRIQTIYVDPVAGNDRYAGLRASRPKRTIQAAVTAVPPMLRHTVTIQLAPGTYNESVSVSNLYSLEEGALLQIVGDTANPSLYRLTGESATTPGVFDKFIGINASQSGGWLVLKGIKLSDYTNSGLVAFTNARVRVENCVIANTRSGGVGAIASGGRLNVDQSSITGANGLQATANGLLQVTNSTISNVTEFYGVYSWNSAAATLTNVTVSNCATHGIILRGGDARLDNVTVSNPSSSSWAVRVQMGGRLLVNGSTFDDNNFGTFRVNNGGSVLFRGPATVIRNGGTAISVGSGGSVHIPADDATVTFTSNSSNVLVGSGGLYSTENEY